MKHSRQRLWQIRRAKSGLCPNCGKPASGGLEKCVVCAVKQRERQRIKRGAVKEYNCLSRRLEKGLE
jgi:hypothetical protein